MQRPISSHAPMDQLPCRKPVSLSPARSMCLSDLQVTSPYKQKQRPSPPTSLHVLHAWTTIDHSLAPPTHNRPHPTSISSQAFLLLRCKALHLHQPTSPQQSADACLPRAHCKQCMPPSFSAWPFSSFSSTPYSNHTLTCDQLTAQ